MDTNLDSPDEGGQPHNLEPDTLRRPLYGLRILNTKSLPEGKEAGGSQGIPPMDAFDRQIYALGGEAVRMPVIQVYPPGDPAHLQAAIRRLAGGDDYQWVLFTSSNAVTAFFGTLAALGYDARILGNTRTAAIGGPTQQALQQHNIQADFIPSRASGAVLGEEIPLTPGARILLPRSEIGLLDLPQALRVRGALVEDVPAYTVGPAPPDEGIVAQLLAGEIQVVAFFSPSGIQALAQMLVAAGHALPLPEVLAPLAVACIGPSTAKAARAMGLAVDILAETYTSAGLVQAIVKWRRQG